MKNPKTHSWSSPKKKKLANAENGHPCQKNAEKTQLIRSMKSSREDIFFKLINVSLLFTLESNFGTTKCPLFPPWTKYLCCFCSNLLYPKTNNSFNSSQINFYVQYMSKNTYMHWFSAINIMSFINFNDLK